MVPFGRSMMDDDDIRHADRGAEGGQDVLERTVPYGVNDPTSPSLLMRTSDETKADDPTQHRNPASVPPMPSGNDDDDDGDQVSTCRRIWNRTVAFYWNNEFVALMVAAIVLAKAYPPLGAEYLAPDITATWIAVILIFILVGLGLKTEEFSKAFQRLYFNIAVQVFNFGVCSSVVFGISRLLVVINVIPQAIADGLVVCASLPLTVNMVLVLTTAAGGDEASAFFNTSFGNLIGVFLSPTLILAYLGVSGSVAVWEIFYKLALRVVLPVVVGQLLQKFSPPVVTFVKKYKRYFSQAQQYLLIFIVYTVFCDTFANDAAGEDDINVADIFIMIAVQFLLLCGLMLLSWYTFRFLFRDQPTLRVMALFGSTHKTVAMGIPMINTIYENDPLVGLYTLPLLIWHPMQLLVGSFLVPYLAAWVEREKKRLGLLEEDEDNDSENNDDGNEPTAEDGTNAADDDESPLSSDLQFEMSPSLQQDLRTKQR